MAQLNHGVQPLSVNITTPIDGSAARAVSLADVARLVSGDVPTVIVDPADHMLVAANVAAEQMLHIGPGRPLALDPSMPAWPSIKAAISRSAEARGGRETLLLWTPAGPQPLPVRLEPVPFADRMLVRIELAPAPKAETRPSAPLPSTNDLATLREIARRIRAGTTGRTEPAPPVAQSRPPVQLELPPPLDFRQTAPSGSAIDEPAAGTEAPAADPGLARLAHELRTPLSAIVSLAEVMRDEQFGPIGNSRYRTYAADIHDSAQHTLEVVMAMLGGGAHAVSGQVDVARTLIECDRLDLNALGRSAISAMQPIAARGGVTLVTEAADGLPMLFADRRAVRQIILNLLSNALRHTPENGRITLSTGRRDDGSVVLAIADTGSGMQPADIARALAQPRDRPLPARLRIAGERVGSGIGLPLVRELVEAHGGTLSIESTVGKGTRVTIAFPSDRTL
jgi:signal transduction histidine kinase